MKSDVIKRSIVIEGQKTSISVEDVFWSSLKDLAKERGATLSGLVASIKARRQPGSNLSSAIRVYILEQMLAQVAQHPGARSASWRAAQPVVAGQRAWHLRGFVVRRNIGRYCQQLETETDEDRRRMLLQLLQEEQAKLAALEDERRGNTR